MQTTTKKIFEVISVDDDPDMLTIFSYLMKMRGCNVTVSHNANDFWDILNKINPDIIFMDIYMNGVNGIDLCIALKNNQSTKNIPVVILSGNEHVREISVSCNADGYLTKPFNIKEVLAEIRRLVPSENEAQLEN